MNATDLSRLMHAVLDGEADAGEAAVLERRLASDPAAREEFDTLRRLFDGMSSIPKAHPPEGLVASVMAQLPQPGMGHGRPRQRFSRSHAIGQDSTDAPDTIPGSSTGVPGFSRQGSYFRSDDTSEQKRGSFGRGKLWVGGGIAAVAVVLALSLSSGIDFPPGSKDTAGTIVPAQRDHAPQNTADDVKLGAPGAAQSTAAPAVPAAIDSAGRAADMSANKSANRAADMSANKSANQAADQSANKSTNNAANPSANQAANQSAN